MSKISDFKLASQIIQVACKSRNVPFIDFNIQFCENLGIVDGILYLQSNSLKETYLLIIETYLLNFNNIYKINAFKNTQQQRETFIKINNFINKLFTNINDTQVTAQRLYQYAFVWILMKDLICPIHKKEIKNIKILCSPSVEIDVSQSYKKEDFNSQQIKEQTPFIYLNECAVYQPLLDSYLLVSAIKSHKLCEVKVLSQIKNDIYLLQKLKGAAQIYYTTQQQTDDFIKILFSIAEIQNKLEQRLQKTAQATQNVNYNHGGMWSTSLYEGLLESLRHPSYNVLHSLNEIDNQFSEKLEKAREKAGKNGLSLQALLKLKNQDMPQQAKNNFGKLIQQALGSDRDEQ